MAKASATKRRSDGVRTALAALAREGVEASWSDKAEGLLELNAVRRQTAGVSRAEAQTAIRDLLSEAIEEVPTKDYRDLLRVVLGMDPVTRGMSAGERRELAGRRFRGGDRVLTSGTIRQYHEPRALDQLASTLLGLDEAEPKQRSRVQDPRQKLAPVASFGDPDGARADPAIVLDEFVPIDFERGRSAQPENEKLGGLARVIVGRKGSGKTLYLRRLNLAQKKAPSVYADLVATRMPPTDQVVRVSGFYPEPIITEKWQGLWRLAILRSVLSHVTFSAELSSFLSPDDVARLRAAYKYLGGVATTPREIGSELRDTLFELSHRAKLDKVLADPRVDDAEYLLACHLGKLPPLYFFLDGLDDEFSHAPMQWQRCQKGLFHQVMHLARDGKLGPRLHLTVALRDVVYASVVRSEHASRFRETPYILNLRWTSALARRFLEAKVRRLAPEVVFGGEASPDVGSWLGREQIYDPSREREILLVDYLIDHTRALPRDVVVLGNMLCSEVVIACRRGTPPTEESIRAITEESARHFGWEQLTIAATQITSTLMPSDFGIDDYTDIYGSEAPYARYGADRLAETLVPYATGRSLTPSDLSELAVSYGEDLPPEKLIGLLWENDLLGVEGERGTAVYRYEVPGEDLRVPTAAKAYQLHPIVRSALAHRD